MTQGRNMHLSVSLLALALLCVAGWKWLPPGSMAAAGVASTVVAIGATAWYFTQRRGAHMRPDPLAADQVANNTASPRLEPYFEAVDEQLAVARTELDQTQAIFTEAIGGLVTSFNDITALAREQQALAVGLTTSGPEGESTGSRLSQRFDVFVTKTS
ncbi:MAG: hypothetical protein V4637_14885, partial [Pseudomonadota bacterium]